MTKPSSLRLLPLLLIAAASAACSAQSDAASSDDPASDEAEVQAARQMCSAAAYDQAFARYKSAVEHSKARARGAVCDEGTMLSEIAADLRASTAACGKFESIIATSRWAQPVRDALQGNLALAMVTGKLGASDLKGLKDALPGSTVYGPAPGVYGNMSKLTFEANGEATLSRLSVSDDGAAHWTDIPAKWSIPAAKKISVEAEGHTTVFDIETEEGDLHFVPASGEEDFRSMPSECEA